MPLDNNAARIRPTAMTTQPRKLFIFATVSNTPYLCLFPSFSFLVLRAISLIAKNSCPDAIIDAPNINETSTVDRNVMILMTYSFYFLNLRMPIFNFYMLG